ncbi:POP1 [Bugula neritina]|uniref:POP1 n=1 Tax=Bugula neritina TaxID=10212 RepID=A0A7J7JYI1_BUGNE|nr:POP1 [Bugula neritina]
MAEVLARRCKMDHIFDAPRELRVTDLAQSHAKEIRALTSAINKINRNRNIIQSVPHYMRRRASSHNMNRIPRRVTGNITTARVTKPKQHSRYYRRRHKHLLEEYTRRQRRVWWMETHIWHAKRFHMMEKWGCKLALCPTAKSERCAYRSIKSHCLIQDHSYIQCIELVAPKELMISTLDTVLPAGQLAKGGIRSYADGVNALTCTLYYPNKYPAGAVSQVDVMFNSNTKQTDHQVWIWCHIAAFKSVWDVLCGAFPVCTEQENSVWRSADGAVSLRSLKDELIRFRLNGPKTKEVMELVLSPFTTDSTAEGAHVWWRDQFSDSSQELTQSSQLSAAFSRDSTHAVVAGMRVRDPRLCMTAIQTHMASLRNHRHKQVTAGSEPEHGRQDVSTDKVENTVTDMDCSVQADSAVTSLMSYSPLWSHKVRDTVSHNMMTQHEINQLRSQLLVPGSEMNLGPKENCVPLLLIVYPEMSDIIIPANWGMAFWLAFAYAGARAGGIRETLVANFYSSRFSFPIDFPDTKVAQDEEFSLAKELQISISSTHQIKDLILTSSVLTHHLDAIGQVCSMSRHLLFFETYIFSRN